MKANQIEQTNQNYLFVISGNSSHVAQIKLALTSFYAISEFGSTDEIMEALKAVMPAAILVDHKLEHGSSVELIEDVRAKHDSGALPIIYTVPVGMGNEFTASFPDVKILEKPYRSSILLNTITNEVNSVVESQWNSIERVQRAALQNSLGTFNNIADLISRGEQITYEKVTADCASLLEAVQNNNYQEMLKGVRGHDNYSYVHSLRVATLLSVFGAAIGIKGDDHMTLTSGGLLHDVGKMEIPSQVLNKPGKLSEEEFMVMKTHVTHTHDFMELSSDLPKGVRIIADQHHERIDGTGYPNGIGGKDLNQLARMAAIIDVFSALTDRRVYKPPMPAEEALALMISMKGHLDMDLTALFREMLLDSAVET